MAYHTHIPPPFASTPGTLASGQAPARGKNKPNQSGFTLIELSIVLVIIGLIVGVIFVGRDLIRASEIRSVISDIDKFKTAVNAFKLKFNALPGDMQNATDYGLGTNGNGNGVIDYGECNNPQNLTNAANVEIFLFWQHLANANLIPGQFSGQAGPGSSFNGVINVNVPSSKMQNGGYAFSTLPPSTETPCAVAIFANANYTNTISFGAPVTNDTMAGPILTPFEAFSIDQKNDDGLPVSGHIVTFNSNWFSNAGFGATNCVTSNNPVTATYNLSYKGIGCHLMFNRVF